MFSPLPHWLLCEVPSFDINWVKHEGGREGGQQLDPAVNVTLVSPLHRCHRRFEGEPIFFTLLSVRTSCLKNQRFPLSTSNQFVQIKDI